MCSAMANALVAPGEGALRTWTTRELPVMTKSSTKLPSAFIA